MADVELKTTIETEKFSLEEKVQQDQYEHKHRQKQAIPKDIEYEIECPRCYDMMTLCSDFDSLYYSCEECGFILFAIKSG
jgi:hypothetical protein